MLDPASQVTIGGALLVVIWMLLKYRPWNSGPKGATVEEVRRICDTAIESALTRRDEIIRDILRDYREDAFNDVNRLFDTVIDKLRLVLKEEIRNITK